MTLGSGNLVSFLKECPNSGDMIVFIVGGKVQQSGPNLSPESAPSCLCGKPAVFFQTDNNCTHFTGVFWIMKVIKWERAWLIESPRCMKHKYNFISLYTGRLKEYSWGKGTIESPGLACTFQMVRHSLLWLQWYNDCHIQSYPRSYFSPHFTHSCFCFVFSGLGIAGWET